LLIGDGFFDPSQDLPRKQKGKTDVHTIEGKGRDLRMRQIDEGIQKFWCHKRHVTGQEQDAVALDLPEGGDDTAQWPTGRN